MSHLTRDIIQQLVNTDLNLVQIIFYSDGVEK